MSDANKRNLEYRHTGGISCFRFCSAEMLINCLHREGEGEGEGEEEWVSFKRVEFHAINGDRFEPCLRVHLHVTLE